MSLIKILIELLQREKKTSLVSVQATKKQYTFSRLADTLYCSMN